jgi:hypothetical protein
MADDWDTRKPLELFFPKVVAKNTMKIALRNEFGKRASAIIGCQRREGLHEMHSKQTLKHRLPNKISFDVFT